jgi:hypothetical protein
MLSFVQKTNWVLKLSIVVLFLIILSTCGISGNENKTGITKEKEMTAQKTHVAHRNEGETINDLKAVKTEKATFALG